MYLAHKNTQVLYQKVQKAFYIITLCSVFEHHSHNCSFNEPQLVAEWCPNAGCQGRLSYVLARYSGATSSCIELRETPTYFQTSTLMSIHFLREVLSWHIFSEPWGALFLFIYTVFTVYDNCWLVCFTIKLAFIMDIFLETIFF